MVGSISTTPSMNALSYWRPMHYRWFGQLCSARMRIVDSTIDRAEACCSCIGLILCHESSSLYWEAECHCATFITLWPDRWYALYDIQRLETAKYRIGRSVREFRYLHISRTYFMKLLQSLIYLVFARCPAGQMMYFASPFR